jgi:hypothetical protein
MKRFFVKLWVFVLPFLITLYGLDVFISKNLAKSNLADNSTWKAIYNGTVNADIVIYGASRALQHIDPAILEDTLHQSAYNLGIHAYNFEMQYLRHKLFLKYNKKPKLIICSLDFMTFQKRADLFNPGQFLPYMLFDSLMRKYTADYIGYKYCDYVIPLVRYYGQGQYIHSAVSLAISKTPNDADRAKGYYGTEQQFIPVFNEGAKDQRPYYDIKFDELSIQLFDRYLAECKAANIKVVFVYTPEYIYAHKFIRNRKQLFDLIHHFSEKYNIPLYDYSSDPMCNNTAYFYNSEHLNRAGSQLFSKKVASDLKRDVH